MAARLADRPRIGHSWPRTRGHPARGRTTSTVLRRSTNRRERLGGGRSADGIPRGRGIESRILIVATDRGDDELGSRLKTGHAENLDDARFRGDEVDDKIKVRVVEDAGHPPRIDGDGI